MRFKTKTFGGKIWKNLHNVSPYNFIEKNFKVPFRRFCRINCSWLKNPSETTAPPCKETNLIFLIYDYFKFLTAKQLSTNFAIVLVQGYALSSSRNEKDEMTNGSHKRQSKINFWNGFLNLANRPWNTVSTKRVELYPIEFDPQLFVACHFIYFAVRWYIHATFRISCTGARTLINQNPIFVPRRIAQLRWFSK